jgi:ABC-2 type transport system ATP-binding protein
MSPRVSTGTPALSVRELKKSYGSFTAVDRLSFDMSEGEILGLLGPNGAGKTTTIQMLLTVLEPTSGRIEYFGRDLKGHRSELLQQVAFASTYVKLPSRLSVNENLDVYGRLYGLTAAERKHRIDKFLKFFGAKQLGIKSTGSLSAGQMTRVMLAKAFLSYPRVALLDEPTASLDPDIALEVRAFVQEQRREHNVAILFTSHNMPEVSEVCDRVMFLQHGKIVAVDKPEKLAASVSTARVELLVGDGLKRTCEFAQKKGWLCSIDQRSVTIAVDEDRIAELLSGLAAAGVSYSQISIQKPTLEDYFLQLARESKGQRT